MRCGLQTFEQYHGRKNIGSSRIRGKWLVKYWKEAELFKMGQKYDAVIYQKSYSIDHARAFKGVKILDLCDPDFLHWAYKTIEMIEECDAITTSTETLAQAVRKFTDKPVVHIPDRIDLTEHTARKFHEGDAKTVVWYGYSSNFDLLKPVIHFLKKLELNLIVISNGGFSIPASSKGIELRNLTWSAETVNRDILEGDIVVNPFMNAGKYKYKSPNKTVTAWALGMPVATSVEDLKKFIPEEARKKESKLRLKEVQDNWDVKLSVLEFQNLIASIKK